MSVVNTVYYTLLRRAVSPFPQDNPCSKVKPCYNFYMGNRSPLAVDEYYHLYNRGVDKRRIFSRPVDYERFIALLYLANSVEPIRLDNLFKQGETLLGLALAHKRDATLTDVCAYCLMPNHVHLLVREKNEGGTSRFMQKLATGYTMYFNTRYERTGALFQGVFKSSHVTNDRYLKYLISYIHLNPVKLIEPKWKETGIKNRKAAEEYLEGYRYSSYLDYLGSKRKENVIIDTSVLPEYFESPSDFKTSVTEWLSFPEPLQ